MKSNNKYSYLAVVWSTVLVSFLLFQNNTEQLDSSEFHNTKCAEAFERNEARIYELSRKQGDLRRGIPEPASAVSDSFGPLIQLFLETNQELYSFCTTPQIESITDESHIQSLLELKRLSDVELNSAWRGYLKSLDKAGVQW